MLGDGTEMTHLHGLIHSFDDRRAIVYPRGTQYWLEKGILHRDSGPAVITHDGERHYYSHGKHNSRPGDLPAFEGSNGEQIWMRDGIPHRDGDKPARIYPGRYQEWLVDGKLHRDFDRPAVVRANGDRMWYRHDRSWRADGKPVVEYADGTVAYTFREHIDRVGHLRHEF